MRALVAPVSLALLAGSASCRAAPEKGAVARAESGRIIVSTTGGSPKIDGWLKFRCDSGAEGEIASHTPAVHVRGGVARSFAMPEYLPSRQDPAARKTSGLTKGIGQLHVLQLPRGRCEFVSYSGVAYGMGAPFTRTVIVERRTTELSIGFDVPANRTAYIGSFNVSEGSPRYSFEDRYERDLGMLKAQDELLTKPDKQIATVRQ